ncbi:ScbA/BarX family gamma-butyrolactone biosynthesis protein [Streptomyces sp. NPDC002054]|uniref:ScbA/BarX family gamma-butyrolactone biosynthesis protein n=1 Tax=Streptomyces sp. NPDC002054 TaxID=3154663 RepID=UPI00331B95F8
MTTTVPREFVHRRSLAEVFLTGYERIEDNVFSLKGQWPRAHTFFTSADGSSHDAVQVGETIRQVGLYLCHAVYGVPLGHHVVFHRLDFRSRPDQLRIGRSPSELSMTAVCPDPRWTGDRFSGSLEVRIHRSGEPVAAGTARLTWVAPATYRLLRGGRGGPGGRESQGPGGRRRDAAGPGRPPQRRTPITASSVGRLLPFDVVLAPADRADRPGRWLLSPDLRHPILFDQADDHHPGMVLVEAARQAACGLHPPGGFTPAAVSTEFHQYAELDAPCWVEARVLAPGRVGVTGRQHGRTVFTSTVTGSTEPTHH